MSIAATHDAKLTPRLGSTSVATKVTPGRTATSERCAIKTALSYAI